MADITWPLTLPQKATLSGYSEERVSELATFQPDLPGPPLTRRRAVIPGAYKVQVSFRMTLTVFTTIFEPFWDNTSTGLAGGSNQLILPDEIRGGSRRIRFTDAYKHQLIAPRVVLVTFANAWSEPV